MHFPEIATIPYLTTAQMREVDRAMIEDYGIALIQMMENAGRNLARLARERFLQGTIREIRVTVLAGSGGNGGGALVCARHLHNQGVSVNVVLTRDAAELAPVTARQLAIVRHMGVHLHTPPLSPSAQTSAPPSLIVDGIIGYSLQGAPRGAAAVLIRWANQQEGVPILALDTPSGLDTTSGAVYDPAIRATATMTLALPKVGLRAPGAAAHVGELYLADISVPPALYAGPGLDLDVGPLFAPSPILRVRL